MAINVKIGGSQKEKSNIKVSVSKSDSQPHKFELNFRRALNGDYMIMEHRDIDIIINIEKKKLVAFAKDLMTEEVQSAETRLFQFMKNKGVVAYDSIQGGNIYGSMEAQIYNSDTEDVIEYTLINLSEWLKEEKPFMDAINAYQEMEDDYFTEPTDEDSTGLGKVPQKAEKGSIGRDTIFYPYNYGGFLY